MACLIYEGEHNEIYKITSVPCVDRSAHPESLGSQGLKVLYTDSTDSDQTVWMPRLI